jgi:hypothetical protein
MKVLLATITSWNNGNCIDRLKQYRFRCHHLILMVHATCTGRSHRFHVFKEMKRSVQLLVCHVTSEKSATWKFIELPTNRRQDNPMTVDVQTNYRACFEGRQTNSLVCSTRICLSVASEILNSSVRRQYGIVGTNSHVMLIMSSRCLVMSSRCLVMSTAML